MRGREQEVIFLRNSSVWTVQAPNGTIYRTNQLRGFMFSHPEWFAKPDTQYVSAYNFVLKKGQKLCMFANGWIVLSNDAYPDIAPSIHWWQAKSPDGKEHLILQERYQHFLKTCGYFDLGDEPYWMFRDGFKKACESGVPITLKNGWIIVRPVSLDEFPVVDIVCDISKPQYILDENGNSRPKRLTDVHSHPKRSRLQWTLADPDGNIYRVENLFAFLRERHDVFPNARSANAMFSQIIGIRCGFGKGKKLSLKNGWTALDRSDVHALIEKNKPRLEGQAARRRIRELEWTLADANGNIYRVAHLLAFLQERPAIFPNARSALSLFSQIIAIRSGSRIRGQLTLKNGWTALDRSDVHDLIEENKPYLAERRARLEERGRQKKRTYYAVWYRNEHDYLDYTEEAQRNLALAHVVAFKSEEKRDEWVNEKVAAYRVPCSAYQARYYVYWHQDKIEVID